MIWGYGPGWGAWLGMGFGMIVFWGLLIVGIVALVRYFAGEREHHGPGSGEQGAAGPERILADRFARGEIDVEEYNQRREVLRGGR